MNFNTYQKYALSTANEYQDIHEQIKCAALGLSGEAGEVAETIKKAYYQGHELDPEELVEELGDALWYIALMADAIGSSLDQIASYNIGKLKRRYPDGFDSKRSVDREV